MFPVGHFVQLYLQLHTIIQAIRRTVWQANSYVEHMWLQLNMLSLGHLSSSVITPRHFKGLLLAIENHLPEYLKLNYNMTQKGRLGSYIRLLLVPEFWIRPVFCNFFISSGQHEHF